MALHFQGLVDILSKVDPVYMGQIYIKEEPLPMLQAMLYSSVGKDIHDAVEPKNNKGLLIEQLSNEYLRRGCPMKGKDKNQVRVLTYFWQCPCVILRPGRCAWLVMKSRQYS